VDELSAAAIAGLAALLSVAEFGHWRPPKFLAGLVDDFSHKGFLFPAFLSQADHQSK
jgi:hypothetical protein